MSNVNNKSKEIVGKFPYLGLRCSGRNSRCFDNLTPGVQAAFLKMFRSSTDKSMPNVYTPQIENLKAQTPALNASVARFFQK